MYCPNCGRSIRPTRFCIYCGKKLPEACLARTARPAVRRAAPRTARRALVSVAAVTAVVCAAAALAIPGMRQASARLGAQIGNAVTRR